MNNVNEKWKPNSDDTIGIFAGILFIAAVYAHMGTVFIGRVTTAFVFMVLWPILEVHYAAYKDKLSAGITLLSLGIGTVGVVAVMILGIEHIIVLPIYIAIVTLVLTNKSLFYLSRGQKQHLTSYFYL